MKFAIDKKIRFGYFSAFILLVISFLLLFSTTTKMLEQTKTSVLTKENIGHLEKLCSSINNIEAGYNGYLLTNDKGYLQMYTGGLAALAPSVAVMSPKFYGDTVQVNNLKEIQLLIKQDTGMLNRGLFLYAQKGNTPSEEVKVLSSASKKITNLIRLKVSGMQALEEARVKQDGIDSGKTSGALKIVILTSMIIATLIAIYSAITYTQENRARRKSDEQALVYHRQVEHRIEELNAANARLDELKNIEKFASSGRMARMIAHEVRNPLTNIGLANDQLKDAVEPNEENTMLLSMIKRNGDRINHLISDLLNATKFSELDRTEIAINDLVDEVLEMAKDSIKLSNVKVEKLYSDNLCKVLIDAEKIKIALLNIIVNAIEAVEPGSGVIEITTIEVNKMCRIIIRDNGTGMNQEILSKIFEPFFTKKDKGNGLGLTNAQNIIFNHKGNIFVESVVGEGSSFHISLHYT